MGCNIKEDEVEQLVSRTVDTYVEEYYNYLFENLGSHLVDDAVKVQLHLAPVCGVFDREYSFVNVLKKELSCDLFQLPLSLQRRLPLHLVRELRARVGGDHYEYWAWSSEVFFDLMVGVQINPLSPFTNVISAFHGALTPLDRAPWGREGAPQDSTVPYSLSHTSAFLVNRGFVVAAVALAALEGVLRDLCIKYGCPRERAEYLQTLSELGAELEGLLGENQEAPPGLKGALGEFMDILEALWGRSITKRLNPYPALRALFEEQVEKGFRGWRILDYWRSRVSRLEDPWPERAYGVALNLISLILWYHVNEDDYNDFVKEVEEKIKRGEGLRFYPPQCP